MSIAELDRLGIKYRQDYIIVKDDEGNVLRDDKNQVVREYTTVSQVRLPLSPVEWCHIAMREGHDYVGGCCGHTSAMQDIINGTFRDGGWIDARHFRELAELAEHHEGFDEFTEDTKPEFRDEASPWEKIGVVWRVAKDTLSLGKMDKPHPRDVHDFDDAVWIVGGSLRLISMAKFFIGDDKDSMANAQRHANHAYNMLQVLPVLRTVYQHLEKVGEDAYRGFGVRKKGTDDPISNAHGLCLYPERKHAEELFKIWREAKDSEVDDWEIVPCVVTVDDGLKWAE